MQPPLIIKQGANTVQVGMQPGMLTVPMTVNSSMAASIPNVMTLNKPGGQNIVGVAQNLGSAQPAILPNVQILYMRPGTPAFAAQKSGTTISPRVEIGTPQVVGTRATAPITLQPRQSLQPGQQGHLLLKTKNGQYQLLRMGPAPAPAARTLAAPQAQTFRLSPALALLEDDDSNSRGATLTPLLPPVLPFTLASPLPNSNATAFVCATPSTASQKPTQPKPGKTITVLQNIPLHADTNINVNKVSIGGTKAMTVNNKANFPRSNLSSGLSTVLTPGRSLLKENVKKASFSQPFGDDKMAGDDDINDVAAMGGVNLAEESQRILGSTEIIGTQIRSCKDEYLVPLDLMQARIKSVAAKYNLDESPPEVASLLTHALQERLKSVTEKLAVIAQHRIDHRTKTDNRYEPTQDVKGQLQFLEELDRVNKKRCENSEREMLLRAAKSRSKNGDPEQAKLKAKAKEMQRAELEELWQRNANSTALQAIGPRKKPRFEGPGAAGDSLSSSPGYSGTGYNGRSQMPLRTRLKHINQRDMMFLLEQDRGTAHSLLMFKSYLK